MEGGYGMNLRGVTEDYGIREARLRVYDAYQP